MSLFRILRTADISFVEFVQETNMSVKGNPQNPTFLRLYSGSPLIDMEMKVNCLNSTLRWKMSLVAGMVQVLETCPADSC